MEWATVFSTVQSDVLAAVQAMIPVGLGIFVVIFGVRKAVQVLRGIAGR